MVYRGYWGFDIDDREYGPDWTAQIVSLKWLVLLTGLGATESGVDCGVIGVVAIASAFVSIAPKLAGAVLGLSGACWKYALEAIINWLLLYFLVHDNRLLSMLELY